jgi:hypothetical protein
MPAGRAIRVAEDLGDLPRGILRRLLELMSVEASELWDDLSLVYADAFVATASDDDLRLALVEFRRWARLADCGHDFGAGTLTWV